MQVAVWRKLCPRLPFLQLHQLQAVSSNLKNMWSSWRRPSTLHSRIHHCRLVLRLNMASTLLIRVLLARKPQLTHTSQASINFDGTRSLSATKKTSVHGGQTIRTAIAVYYFLFFSSLSQYDSVLGTGAYKTVYRALDTEEAREVAWCELRIKVCIFCCSCPHSQNESARDRERMDAEVELLLQASHQNITRCYGAWRTDNNGYVFITELAISGTLRECVAWFLCVMPQLSSTARNPKPQDYPGVLPANS